MAFALMANFPLGYYRAHIGDGEVDPQPSPARLHSALLAAAGSGVRAEVDTRTQLPMPCTSDLDALRWLEEHPPDGLVLPETRRPHTGHLRFRSTGTLPKEGTAWTWDKKSGDRPEPTVALAGDVGWTWSESPPQSVAEALEGLVGEASHLGTAESPVRLRLDDVAPTHTWLRDATPWSRPGVDVDTAATGRTQALMDAHVDYMTRKVPAERKHPTQDDLAPPPRVAASLSRRRYVSVTRHGDFAPWDSAVLIPLSTDIPVRDRVLMAVRFHRALIAEIGDGAPAIVTGHYPDGASRPANRIAIQFLDPGLPSRHLTGSLTSLAVLIPNDAPSDDLAIVLDALDRMQRFTGVGGGTIHFRRDKGGGMVDAADFWDPPDGERVWRTAAPAISDVRPSRAEGWDLARAIALSVGLVWRDRLDAPGRGMAWMTRLADLSTERGVITHSVRPIRHEQGRYVHRVHPNAVVAPYDAALSLGRLSTGRELVAIGQTRHLGGGLLLPIEGGRA